MTQRYNAIDFLSRFTDVEKSELFKVLDVLPTTHSDGPWLAGGAIRRTITGKELESDFDFFFKNADQLASFKYRLETEGASKAVENDHVETFHISLCGANRIIQLIKFQYYESAEDVIDSFDFTISQTAYDGTDFIFGRYTLWDLPRRKLALHKLTYGVATMRRLIKYTNQGFTACSGVMQAILEAVVDNPAVIQSDVQYLD